MSRPIAQIRVTQVSKKFDKTQDPKGGGRAGGCFTSWRKSLEPSSH